MNCAAIVLAAGSSQRFGSPKHSLQLEGETLAQRTCRIAEDAGCAPILLVKSVDATVQENFSSKVTVLINPHASQGMGTSLAMAVKHLLAHQAAAIDAALVLLVDQPAIETPHLETLRDALDPPHTTIALAKHDEITGPPACFHHSHFAALSELTGDQGGKKIAKAHPYQTKGIPIPEATWDVDTPESWTDFLQFKGQQSTSGAGETSPKKST